MEPWIYLIILAVFAVLAVASAKEALLTDRKLSAISKIFRRIAVRIYKHARILTGKIYRKTGRRILPGSEMVSRDLMTLNPSGRAAKREMDYRIDKLATFCAFLVAGALLGLMIYAAEWQQAGTLRKGYVTREDYGGDTQQITASVSARTAKGEQPLGTYVFSIGPKQYTEKQAEEMAERAEEELKEILPGSNPDLEHVSSSLTLPSQLEGYPFRILWSSSDYSLVDTDGSVASQTLAEGTSVNAELEADLKYEEFTHTCTFPVTVVAAGRSADEKIEERIRDAVAETDRASASSNGFHLPQSVDGVSLKWSFPSSGTGAAILILVTGLAFLNYMMSDYRLHKKTQKRAQQMKIDYPQLVSKLTLYLGAGMSVRNAFHTIAREYERRKNADEIRYAYEEVRIICHELDSGISENTAYARFGARCRLREYSRLSSLLTQNLKKGNSELLRILEAEAQESFEERRNIARKLGEEASTKLLLPMVMMLCVTLVIIVIPAYLSFSV